MVRHIYIYRVIGVMWGLYWDNGKENGIYYIGFRVKCRPMINNGLDKAQNVQVDSGMRTGKSMYDVREMGVLAVPGLLIREYILQGVYPNHIPYSLLNNNKWKTLPYGALHGWQISQKLPQVSNLESPLMQTSDSSAHFLLQSSHLSPTPACQHEDSALHKRAGQAVASADGCGTWLFLLGVRREHGNMLYWDYVGIVFPI